MTQEQQAAFIHAQSVCALAKIEGMKAENMICESLGHLMAYDEKAFVGVINTYGISHNSVLALFQGITS